jgi:uncharacterized membrane protein
LLLAWAGAQHSIPQTILDVERSSMPEETVQTGLSDSAASGLAYLTFIPAIVFLAVPPYNQSANVRFHSWQSIFLSIAAIAASILHIFLLFIPIIGWIISLLISLTFLVVWLLCILKAFNGQRFVLPVLGALAAKQAGG